MAQKNNNWFENIRGKTFELITKKNVDLDDFSAALNITRETFIENYSHEINDFPFYIEVLVLLEAWEG